MDNYISIIEENEIIRNVAHSFHEAGFELWLVGGFVRDYIYGHFGKDIDFCTNANPDEIWNILNEYPTDGYICVPFDIGKAFGTCGLTVYAKNAKRDKLNIEVTTFRSESYVRGSRKPMVNLGGTIYTDLARRDFTYNAIAINALTGEMLDPYNGIADLKNGIVRAVGNSADRFTEDPLRMLRAARFAARFGHRIDSVTEIEMNNKRVDIDFVSRERIADELNKIMETKKPSIGLNYLFTTGLLMQISPAFSAFNDPRGNGDKRDNLFVHTMKVVDNVSDPITRWAALFHDMGKPLARREKGGVLTFYTHEQIGADIAENVLTELRFSNDIINAVSKLVKMHMRVNLYRPEMGDSPIRRFILELGDLLPNALELTRYDKADYKIGRPNDIADYIAERVVELTKEPIQPPIDGVEIMERFSLKPGPIVGKIKNTLLEQVISGELSPSDKESAFAIVQEMINKPGVLA